MKEISTKSSAQRQNIRTEKIWSQKWGPVRQTGHYSYKKVRGKPNAGLALLWLGSGLVKGFAVTLLIGVVVSMFTAVTCSRTLMLLVVLSLPKVRQKPELFCPNLNIGTQPSVSSNQ